MPSKSRKKGRCLQIKRLQVSDASGWTHIIRRTTPKANSQEELRQEFDSMTILDNISQKTVSESHSKYTRCWVDSECCANLSTIIEQDIIPLENIEIKRCVCLGLGSLTSSRDSSKYELAALISILEILGKHYTIKETILQDPAFNVADIEFLHSLGHKVVSTPSAFQSIDRNTFLFAPHLESNIYATALKNVHPAICIGSDVSTFVDRPIHTYDAEARPKERDIFQCYSDATVSRPLPDFDRDTWTYFTRIYWPKVDEDANDDGSEQKAGLSD